jgi:hypothetical protein
MAVDLVALRNDLMSRGWTDHVIDNNDGTFIYMIHRPDRAINWNTIFVADNGYVSLDHEALSLDGETVEESGGWAISVVSQYWDDLDLIRKYVDADDRADR